EVVEPACIPHPADHVRVRDGPVVAFAAEDADLRAGAGRRRVLAWPPGLGGVRFVDIELRCCGALLFDDTESQVDWALEREAAASASPLDQVRRLRLAFEVSQRSPEACLPPREPSQGFFGRSPDRGRVPWPAAPEQIDGFLERPAHALARSDLACETE